MMDVFSARPIYVLRLQWQKYSWKTFIFLNTKHIIVSWWMLFSRFFRLVLCVCCDCSDGDTVGKTFIFLVRGMLYFLVSFGVVLSWGM